MNGKHQWTGAHGSQIRGSGGLIADNNSMALSGVLAATGAYSALYDLAAAAESTSGTPAVYSVVKRYAGAMQTNGWEELTPADRTWLEDLALQREVLGSAQASAWLRGLGMDELNEVIMLPLELRSLMEVPTASAVLTPEPVLLEVYPNPANGSAYIAYQLPVGITAAALRVLDMTGREVAAVRSDIAAGLFEFNTATWPNGLYVAELTVDGVVLGTVKVGVQQ